MKCWSRGVPRAERVLEQFKLQVTPKHQELQGGQNKLAHILYALTLPNINRFSKLFHYQNQQQICNNTITKDLTTPRVCHYTTL